MAKNLPYGHQRRLEIARALASDPKLLLLDEPTAGMNPNEKDDLMSLIRGLRDRLKLTILLIEHDMKVVMDLSERISVLDYGVKIAEGSPAEVRAKSVIPGLSSTSPGKAERGSVARFSSRRGP